VVSDPDTNSLTVRDTAENVKLIGELLESIDKDRAEVVMDVDIFEVNSSDMLKFGNQLGNDTTLVNLGGVRGAGAVFNGLAQGALGLPASFGAALILPTSSLQAFQNKSNGRLLASTQIHAFNNEESSARIGQRVPVQTAQAYPFGRPEPISRIGGFSPAASVINYEPTGGAQLHPSSFRTWMWVKRLKIGSKDVTAPTATRLLPSALRNHARPEQSHDSVGGGD
jgi:hypothetical protein